MTAKTANIGKLKNPRNVVSFKGFCGGAAGIRTLVPFGQTVFKTASL